MTHIINPEHRILVNWLVQQYDEDEHYCILLITRAAQKYSFPVEQFFEGCKELLKIHGLPRIFSMHLDFLGYAFRLEKTPHEAALIMKYRFLESQSNPN